MYAQQGWGLLDEFLCPCIFTTDGIVITDILIMSYRAADQKVVIAWTNINDIL